MFTSWLNCWADPVFLGRTDLAAQRSLALRLARALSQAPAEASAGEHSGQAIHLLLQGVQARLGVQVQESRLYGMAVAEVMGRTWPHSNGEKGGAALAFVGFDMRARGLSAFSLAGARFQIAARPTEACLGVQEAALLSQLRGSTEVTAPPVSTTKGLTSRPKALEAHALKPMDDDSVDPPPVVCGFAPRRPQACSAVSDGHCIEVDSDDDDDDDPLCGAAPLPFLHSPPDACSDLRLVQPPNFLRSAFEMLLGPPKDRCSENLLAPLSESAASSATGSSGEMPAAARARIVASLSAIPGLAQANPQELTQLTEPLCEQILRLDDVPGLADCATLRRSALASLVISDTGRRIAARCLITEFAVEDLTLAGRLLILDVLADAARELSNRTSSAETPVPLGSNSTTSASTVASHAEVACLPPSGERPRTRRFASACREPPGKLNRFSVELQHFVLPLIARWRQPDPGSARWASSEPSLVGSLLQCLGTLLECGGSASPDRDVAASAALELVSEHMHHIETFVRRCSLFLLSRILLVGADAMVLSHPTLVDRLEVMPLREGDDTCRRMAGGVLAWLSQRASL